MPIVNGVTYNDQTSAEVIDALERARSNHERVRIFYGEPQTGVAWSSGSGVTGTIGTSSGKLRVPILLHNAQSSGGAEILTHCIVAVRMMQSNSRTVHCWYYRHPTFDPGVYVAFPAEEEGHKWAVLRDGVIERRFMSEANAERWAQFMMGGRGAP